MDALARAAADARKSDQKFTARDLFGPLSDDLDDGAVLEKPKPEKKSAKPAKKKKVRKTKKVKKFLTHTGRKAVMTSYCTMDSFMRMMREKIH